MTDHVFQCEGAPGRDDKQVGTEKDLAGRTYSWPA
jgi:hypothetical protein